MAAALILLTLGPILLVLAAARIGRNAGRVDGASRAWLIVGTIFVVVALYLWRLQR